MKQPKLVMIPGLNGNDLLCREFLDSLPMDVKFIPLPEDCPQDHESIAESVTPLLPQEPFILLLESFAGSIGPNLLKNNDIPLQGLIFFVSLLATPSKPLLALSQLVSAKTILKLPFIDRTLSRTFLNNDANPEQVQHVKQVIHDIPDDILKQRTKALAELKSFPRQPDIPVAYVEASNDRVLNQRALDSIEEVFPQAEKYPMQGSHFLLYTKPQESAQVVTTIYERMIEQLKK
ncbi:alpha/beta hydrolase family protein [Kangiella sediminilitoris]|uniref:Alpha/beta hydrolase n=1 Tax=Kangiella sediminilitoris TaxID=1144748 RepID=A0A1B3B811_9GAMM|nr:hypothetical protein [Kangiella sediminilitoris]AOE48929.1 hypothetical protein KS2013_201 [Kangiella sediminilitoris]